MYHPTILKLDAVAADFHAMGNFVAKDSAFRLAGQLQLELLSNSPYPKTRRWLHAQWAWALGHIGLLWQLVRWFRLREPGTQLVLVAKGAANPWFLAALQPYITIVAEIPDGAEDEAMRNAVYFGCPDGVLSLINFNKQVERDCRGDEPLALSTEQALKGSVYRSQVTKKIHGAFVAVHARYSEHEPERNVTVEQIEIALEPWHAKGFDVICTGLDPHPINERYPSVTSLVERYEASFLLSAGCSHFIGSNSGAWTIAHAFGRPVTIINDRERAAWIYP